MGRQDPGGPHVGPMNFAIWAAVLQKSRDEYYTADSLGTLFETIPGVCIVEFLRELWRAIYPLLCNSFMEHKQLWGNHTREVRLICPEGRMSSLDKCKPIQYITWTNVNTSPSFQVDPKKQISVQSKYTHFQTENIHLKMLSAK